MRRRRLVGEFIAAYRQRRIKADEERRARVIEEQRERAHRWERGRFWLDLAAVMAAVGAAYFLFGQQHIMKGQLDEMRDEQRPWVYSDVPVFLRSITQNRNGVWEINIQFTLHNTGHLPAFNVTYVLDSPIPVMATPDTIVKYQHEKCTTQEGENTIATGYTVFPGQVVKDGVTIGIWPFDADRAARKYTVCLSGLLDASSIEYLEAQLLASQGSLTLLDRRQRLTTTPDFLQTQAAFHLIKSTWSRSRSRTTFPLIDG